MPGNKLGALVAVGIGCLAEAAAVDVTPKQLAYTPANSFLLFEPKQEVTN